MSDYFQREVRPLLTPIGLDPAHPFSQVANKSLNFVAELSGRDAFGRETTVATVKAPRLLPRVIALPRAVAGADNTFVLLSSVIHAHLHELFGGREIVGYSQFRVTRDADLWFDEEEVKNLRQALESELPQRHFGQAVRLEVAANCPPDLPRFLLRQFELAEDQQWPKIYRVAGRACVGIVAGDKGFRRPQDYNAVLLTVLVNDVDAWYDHLKGQDVKFLIEIQDKPEIQVRCFLH